MLFTRSRYLFFWALLVSLLIPSVGFLCVTYAQTNPDLPSDGTTGDGTTGTDRLRVKSQSKTAFIQSAEKLALEQLNAIDQIDPEKNRNEYVLHSAKTTCELENLYIESLYNDFVKEHGTLMNAIFMHIRKKMNETASDLDDLTSSAEPLSQYKLSNETVPAMTVGSFVQTLLIYQKQLLEVGAVNWAALGFDLEGLKKGIIALNRKFSISFSAMENHSIYVGDEQPFPKVYIKTRMGSDPTWVQKFPFQKVRAGINSEQTWIAAEQEISSLSTAISDELIWKIIRNHRVSINKIPIDGQERRNYVESLRTKKCWKDHRRVFRNLDAGPYVKSEQGMPCPRSGVQIIEVIRNNRTLLSRNESEKEDVTNRFSVSNGQLNYSYNTNAHSLSKCAHVTLQVTYTCGCDVSPRTMNIRGKAGVGFNIQCED